MSAVRPVGHALAVLEEYAARAERQGNAWAVRLARIQTHRLVPGADLTLVRRGRPRKAAA